MQKNQPLQNILLLKPFPQPLLHSIHPTITPMDEEDALVTLILIPIQIILIYVGRVDRAAGQETRHTDIEATSKHINFGLVMVQAHFA